MNSPSFLKKNDRILFQGDSVTHAFRKPEEVGTSYQLGAGWVMILAARLHAEHPELNFRFENRGVCGDGASELLKRWDEDCLALKPTVLSLLVGVNDTVRKINDQAPRTLELYRNEVEELLTRTREAHPDVRFILCDPFILETGAVDHRWREDLSGRQEIIKSLAKEYDAVHVPLQDELDKAAKGMENTYWLFDGVHPHAAAQWLIAEAWLKQVLHPLV